MKQILLYLLISITSLGCKTIKTKTLNPVGTYELGNINPDEKGYFGIIQVKPLNQKSIVMTFMINKGAPSYNSGSFVDTLDYKLGKAIYTAKEFDPSCKITFRFTEDGVHVNQKNDGYYVGSGFGHSVVASGYFKKTSSKSPILREPLTDEILEF
ncbi:MAG: hypothetical protein ACPGSD_09940 [Flavobacteriales bacterium]